MSIDFQVRKDSQ